MYPHTGAVEASLQTINTEVIPLFNAFVFILSTVIQEPLFFRLHFHYTKIKAGIASRFGNFFWTV